MNKLIIDTTDRNKTTIKLQLGEQLDKLSEKAKPKSQTALILIDRILKRNNLSPGDLDEIEVNARPGSFTGTRVGVAIANALGFGLDVLVNKKRSKIVTPKYF